MAVIDGVILKDRCIVIHNTIQKQALEQHYINHMGMDKTKLLVYESIYWPGINSDTEKHIKYCSTCLAFQPNKIKGTNNAPLNTWKPREVVGTDMFTLLNKNYLCIVHYHSKFPIIKKTEDLAAESPILHVKLFFFSKYGLTRKIISDTGANFISEKFCRKLNIEHTASSSYYH